MLAVLTTPNIKKNLYFTAYLLILGLDFRLCLCYIIAKGWYTYRPKSKKGAFLMSNRHIPKYAGAMTPHQRTQRLLDKLAMLAMGALTAIFILAVSIIFN